MDATASLSWKKPINYIAYARNDRILVAGGVGGQLVLWDAANGHKLAEIFNSSEVMTALGISPNGNVLATGDDAGSLRLYEITTRKELLVLEHSGSIETLAFSLDGKIIAAAGRRGTFSAWNATTGEKVSSWVGHDECWVLAMVFVSDTIIASSGLDRVIRFWDARTGKLLVFGNADLHSAVYHLAFCPATKKLTLLSGIGHLMVLAPPSGNWETSLLDNLPLSNTSTEKAHDKAGGKRDRSAL